MLRSFALHSIISVCFCFIPEQSDLHLEVVFAINQPAGVLALCDLSQQAINSLAEPHLLTKDMVAVQEKLVFYFHS